MSTPPRALFFDMDDTLLDSRSAAKESWDQLCAEYSPLLNCEAPVLREAAMKESIAFWKDESAVEKEWRTNLTEARARVLQAALESQGWDHRHAVAMANRYDEIFFDHLNLFDDAIATLDTLRSRGHVLGLITNGPKWLQRKKIATFEIEPYFDVVVIEGEFGHGKPNAAVFEHALKATKTEAAAAWHTGDNQYADIGGAQKAGIHAVWIHRDRMELSADHPTPDRAITHLDELVAALD